MAPWDRHARPTRAGALVVLGVTLGCVLAAVLSRDAGGNSLEVRLITKMQSSTQLLAAGEHAKRFTNSKDCVQVNSKFCWHCLHPIP